MSDPTKLPESVRAGDRLYANWPDGTPPPAGWTRVEPGVIFKFADGTEGGTLLQPRPGMVGARAAVRASLTVDKAEGE